jgi:hypothetical protein
MFNNKKRKKLEQQVKYLTHIIENPLKFKKGDKLFYLNKSNKFEKVIITNGYVNIISNEEGCYYINCYRISSPVSGRSNYGGYYSEDKLFTKEQLKKI